MKQVDQIIGYGTALLFIFDGANRIPIFEVVAIPIASAAAVVEAASTVVFVVRTGPEVPGTILIEDIVVVPAAGKRQKYTLTVRAGNIVSADSVV